MSITILIIDDEPRVLRAFARNLRLGGYTVFTAESGRAGLELYHQEQPEIVITDLRMPDLSGLDVLQAIRAHDPEANVILVSGHGGQDAILEALRAGASDFLAKPVDQVTLESALRRAVERVHLKRKLRASQEALREQNARLEEEVAKRTAELRQTTRRFQALLDHSPALVHIFDEEGRYLLVGEATAKALEIPREEIMGKTFADLLPPETAATFMRRVETLKETRAELFVEDQITVNGEDQFFESLLFPLSEEDGEAIYASIATDVTERKQAEAALRESEKRFRMTIHLSPIGVGIVDSEGNMTDCNAALAEIVGYSREELLRLSFKDFTHPDDLEREWQLINELWAEETTEYRMEKRYLHRDGHIVWVDVAASLFNDETGKLAFGFAFVQDITARKRAEDALRESEERFRLIAETSSDVIFQLDSEGRITYCSPSVERVLGLTPDEVVGTHLRRYFPATGLPQAMQNFQRAAAAEQIEMVDAEIVNRAGKLIPIEATLTPIIKDGRVVGVQGAARDITARKQMEKALRESESRVKRKLKSILSPAGDLSSLDLVDIIDVEAIQSLMDHFYALTHIGIAIVDMEGEVLVATGWQDICTKFHRVHPKTRQYCIESDTALSTGIAPGDHKLYKCKNNIWDMATPIVVGGRHVGNLFLGQFFFDDETVDREAFRKQAEVYGFDEAAYLTALDRVPRWPREKVRTVFKFYTELATLISQLSHSNLNLAQSLAEKKRLIAELKESERTFKSYIEHAPYGVFVANEQGRYVEVNAAACQMTGYERDELLNMQIVHLTPPEHREAAEEHFRTVVAEGGATGIAPFIRKDGTLRWWSVVAVRLTDTRFLGYTEDVTARKRAEEEQARLTTEVRTQAKQMAQILATAPAGVLLLDATGRVLQANTVAERDLAVLAGVAVGDPLTRLGDRPLAELLTSPPVKGLWHEIEVDDRTFEILARPVENGPVPEQWVLVINDVTEERQIRAQIQQQAQLAAVGQLAAGIAHDFNNIMAVIVLYTKMGLRIPDVPPQLRARLEVVSQQAQRATDLIEQILDFGRRAVLKRQPMDLAPFLQEMVKLLERTLPENIKVKLNFGRDDYIINADPTRIQQVIMNLAINARDAMRPQGSGELRIDLARMAASDKIRCVTCGQALGGDNEDNEDNGAWIRIAVTDNGSGIPPEALPHIFEPFFTTKEVGEGAGLGLAQVFGIVKQHEGHIDVTSQVGRGTTFTLYLPALRVRPPTSPAIERGTLIRGQGETVLVVEDNAALRAAMIDILELLNYQALPAANGRAALAVLEQRADEIAVVLSDLVMPEMGGQALFHAMRQRGLTLPVVMLSGHPMERELEALQAQGLAGWMLKPLDGDQLAQLLAQVLDKESEPS